ncbi:phage holin family protein [Streptomyces sp. NPDC055239]
MNRLEHLDQTDRLDKGLVDELTRAAREAVRDELREQTRKQRRTAALYAGAGAVGFYAGAALALAFGLVLALGLPGWAAALITAVVLGVVAWLLRGAARPSTTRPSTSGLSTDGPSTDASSAAGPTVDATDPSVDPEVPHRWGQ